jgi:hypothetical protein
MKFSFITMAIVCSLSAFAGDKGNIIRGEVSNVTSGYTDGDVIVCRNEDGQIKKAYLLDYAEIDVIDSTLIQFDSSKTDQNFITDLAYNLVQVSPDLFSAFQNLGVRIAYQSSRFLVNLPLANQGVHFFSNQPYLKLNNDKVTRVIKNLDKNCLTEQAVMAQKNSYGIEFTLNAEIFAKLSQRDRRGLMIHEAIFFSVQHYYGDLDSARSRYIHQRLMQYQLNELNRTVILDILNHSYTDFIKPH